MLNDKKINNVRVISSPFVRCLMTAEQIARKLGVEFIEVDELLSEMLCTQFFPTNPMGSLYYRSPAQCSKYVQLPLKHIERPVLVYPESNNLYAERTNKVFEEYEKLAKEDEFVVLVSHGYAILFVLEPRGQFDFEKGVDYCCMCAF